ncbi:unnamed protein product, partial [Discosporangium mesarthrocarpum]
MRPVFIPTQDKRLNIWSIATGRHVRGYRAEEDGSRATGGTGGSELYKVDLDPTGMYAAACSFDRWIWLFDFYSGRCLARVAGHSQLATGVCFTSDGRRLVTTGGDGCIFVWRLSTGLQRAMRERRAEMRGARGRPGTAVAAAGAAVGRGGRSGAVGG